MSYIDPADPTQVPNGTTVEVYTADRQPYDLPVFVGPIEKVVRTLVPGHYWVEVEQDHAGPVYISTDGFLIAA